MPLRGFPLITTAIIAATADMDECKPPLTQDRVLITTNVMVFISPKYSSDNNIHLPDISFINHNLSTHLWVLSGWLYCLCWLPHLDAQTCFVYWALPCDFIPKLKHICPYYHAWHYVLCDSVALAVVLRIPFIVAKCLKCGEWMDIYHVEYENTIVCRMICCRLILDFYSHILE